MGAVIWKEIGLNPLVDLWEPPGQARGNWDSLGGHRHRQELFMEARSTMRTLVQASPIWSPPSGLLVLGAYLSTNWLAPDPGLPSLRIQPWGTQPCSPVDQHQSWALSPKAHSQLLGPSPIHQWVTTAPSPPGHAASHTVNWCHPSASQQPPHKAGPNSRVSPGASPAYQHAHSSQPHYNRRAHAAHIGSTPRAYSSDVQRGGCCWTP